MSTGTRGAAASGGKRAAAGGNGRKSGARRAAASPAFGYGDLGLSLIFIFPLFLCYEVGVPFTSSMNGVDFVTGLVYGLIGNRNHYLIVHGVLALLFLGYLIYLRRTRSFTLSAWPAMFFEAGIYALTLGTAIALVMEKLLGFDMSSDLTLLIDRVRDIVVVSLGAGVHEELVFRLVLMGGGAAALMKLGVTRWPAVFLAMAVSAVLFSGAHHVGPYGEPLELTTFTYRTLAGIAFGLIFYFRSLSHAVYAHFLYDVYVLTLREFA